MTTYVRKVIPSPVGALTLVASDAGLVAILWENDDPQRVRVGTPEVVESHPVLDAAVVQLAEYFSGGRRSFEIPLAFEGTDFQKKVWQALLTIPYGETRTYAEIARQVESADAVRAVGAANGKNPISIIAPCHRVIGSNGTLTGFAGGMAAKEYLLKHEGALPPTLF